jgi:FtsP/CotA-like multicopper oxidase with cupredoxin domain
MRPDSTRREFLLLGGAAVGGAAGAGPAAADEAPVLAKPAANFAAYSRWRPTYGGPPTADHYLGKLVPGLRAAGLPPVPVEMPDLPKLPHRVVRGAKEFEIRCTHVKREFLPGYPMDVWGYNGTMPGPLVEANQGDRVRFVVHNELPEPTTVH